MRFKKKAKGVEELLLIWRFNMIGELTINGQRERIIRRLQKTPSLKSALNDFDGWADALLDARIEATQEATQETGIEIQRFPPECPWTTDEILNPTWKPAE